MLPPFRFAAGNYSASNEITERINFSLLGKKKEALLSPETSRLTPYAKCVLMSHNNCLTTHELPPKALMPCSKKPTHVQRYAHTLYMAQQQIQQKKSPRLSYACTVQKTAQCCCFYRKFFNREFNNSTSLAFCTHRNQYGGNCLYRARSDMRYSYSRAPLLQCT